MFLKTLVVGMIETNCYLLGCQETGEGAVLDPGEEPERILAAIRQSGLRIRYIINTHGHVDHIMANGGVKEATGASLLIHRADAEALTNPRRSLLAFTGGTAGGSPPADRLLEEGDTITVGRLTLRVIHTPGHTPGGITLQVEKALFTGDTLFAGSIGRTDFPGGSYEQLLKSIKEKLLPLGDDLVVYPGHGPASTLGEERVSNPFLLM